MSFYRRPRLAAGRSLQTCRPRFPACSGKDMATMDQANVNMRAITIYLLSETITCTVYSTTALLFYRVSLDEYCTTRPQQEMKHARHFS